MITTDQNQALKTLTKITFLVNLVLFIVNYFKDISVKSVLITNLILLGLIVGMDALKKYLDKRFSGKWTGRIGEFRGQVK